MKVAKLSDVKNGLSRYVRLVRRGERVRILVRGAPAADLVPVSDVRAETESSLLELERDGIIRRGRGSVPSELLRAGPRGRGKSLSQVLIDERRAGR